MSKRTVLFLLIAVLAVINALNALEVIAIGSLIWPLAIGTIVVAFFLVTTPREKGDQSE